MSNPNTAYTNGAYIVPKYLEDTKRWVWIIYEFDDDTYLNGNLISPDEVAPTLETLINKNLED